MTDNTRSTFFETRIQHLISASQPPDKVGGITHELILQVFNNWPRISLPVGDRGRAVSRTGINDGKFLTMISVTGEGLQLVCTCRRNSGSLPGSLETHWDTKTRDWRSQGQHPFLNTQDNHQMVADPFVYQTIFPSTSAPGISAPSQL